MSVDQALLDYYAGLLIVQYASKPKAVQTIQLLVNQALCDGLPQEMTHAFDLDTAVGSQLDILGRIVGVNRDVYGLDLAHNYFQYNRYNTNSTVYGFQLYNGAYNSTLFLRYNTDAVYTLTDTELRTLIKLKIILNNSDSSLYSIMNALNQFFPGQISLVDNKDMTITYTVSVNLTNALSAAIYLGILPKPMGVSATINYV